MDRLIKQADLNHWIKQVTKGEITMSKMVENINIKHTQKMADLRFRLKDKKDLKQAQIDVLYNVLNVDNRKLRKAIKQTIEELSK